MAAFHGDIKMLEAIKKTIAQANISIVIETGTFHGDSARAFAANVKFVHTIEIREDFYRTAIKSGAITNISYHLGSSNEILPHILKSQKPNERILFFLDAHWQDYWPLKDELIIVNKYRSEGNKVIIVIDDFEVPDKPNFFQANGGGGTIGSPVYGPRTREDDTPCNLKTYGDLLKDFKEVWFPCYDDKTAGYIIASDYVLDLAPVAKRYQS